MIGLFNVDKPSGLTSRRVVDHIHRLVRPAKAGHAGTLDPLASGVLVICVGAATRLIEYVQRAEKRYTATFLLGRSSDTEDVEGQVEELPDAPVPSREQIVESAQNFLGEIQQRPPAFSALKVKGKRAYDLARQGKPVDLPPRTVRIDFLNVLKYEYPRLVVDVGCGSGTYIRSLGRDLAESLGTAAVMSDLVRTAIGGFRIEDACQLDELDRESLSRWLLPILRAVESLPIIELTAQEAREIAHGRVLLRRPPTDGQEWAAISPDGQLAAILVPHPEGLRPLRNLIAEN